MSTTAIPHPAGSALGEGPRRQVDPRGQRVAAAISALVLASALLAGQSSLAIVLLGLQAVVFAVGVTRGPAATPYAWVFRAVVRPRLAPADELEDAAPPRFAQGCGLAFTVVGLVGLLAELPVVAFAAVAGALAAAFLNAAFGICLGCEMYLRGLQLRARVAA